MEKIAIWPDYDWCYVDDLDDYLNFKSDDYLVVDLPDDLEEIDFEYLECLIDGCKFFNTIQGVLNVD